MVYVFTTQWRDTQMKRQFASQLERIVSRHLTRMPLGAIASHTGGASTGCPVQPCIVCEPGLSESMPTSFVCCWASL